MFGTVWHFIVCLKFGIFQSFGLVFNVEWGLLVCLCGKYQHGFTFIIASSLLRIYIMQCRWCSARCIVYTSILC